MKTERLHRSARLLGVIWLIALVAVPFLGCLGTCFRPMWAPAWPELASYFSPQSSSFNPPPQPFDEAKWQRGYATDRIAMGKTLAGSDVLVGMSRDQVEGMLGAPDKEYGQELRWHLGTVEDGSFFGWDVKLIVRFDCSGLVSGVELYWAD